MAIREVGIQNILLTEEESRCFYIGRAHQRRGLLRRLLQLDFHYFKDSLTRLNWSANPFIHAIQLLVLIIVIPFVLAWALVRKVLALLAFPFAYLGTFFIPSTLKAPGEKTLVGIHNAFVAHLDLGVSDHIACLNDWVRILYGEQALQQRALDGYLEKELQRLLQSRGAAQAGDYSPTVRNLVAIVREKISRELGHYGEAKRARASH